MLPWLVVVVVVLVEVDVEPPPGMHSGDSLESPDGQQMSAFPPRSRELLQTRPVSQSSLPLSMLQRSPSPWLAHAARPNTAAKRTLTFAKKRGRGVGTGGP